MPRLLVDLLFYTGRRGGMESYVRELYARMPDALPGWDLVGLASLELAGGDRSWFPGEVVDSGITGASRVRWAAGELTAVSRHARRVGAAVVHAPANVGPMFGSVPVVLTVHDLLPFRHPEWVPGPYAPVLRGLVRAAARAAAEIVTISSASAADILQFLHRDATVIPLAGSSEPESIPLPADGHVLAVGNRMPHKNVEVLLHALARIPEDARPRLVLTGSSDRDPLRSVVSRLGLQSSVTLKEWVDADELERLYRDASMVAVPSRFEGFGLPVLDGMARGRPVLASDLPVLREVAADAALFVDSTSPVAVADAILRILSNEQLRATLATLGVERASSFGWAATAASTADVIQRAAARHRSSRRSTDAPRPRS